MKTKPAIYARSVMLLALVALLPSFAHASNPISSPAYADYNTFLDMINVLELVSVGTEAVQADITAYGSDGTEIRTVRTIIESGQQQDFIVNDLINQQTDTYGVVQIEFVGETQKKELIGRMSYYRLNDDGLTYSYAFSRQLNEPSSGTTFATANSFDPQGRGYIVPNWLQVTNLSSTAQGFLLNLYDQTGSLLGTQHINLDPFQRWDAAAGHEQGQGVYLNQVIPDSADADYLSAVTRYGSNALPGKPMNDFAFAFALDTRTGTGDTQFSIISNLEGQCFTQTNWVEVINVTTSSVAAALTFYDEEGDLAGTTSVNLYPHSQYHFNGSALIDAGTYGSVHIASNTPSGLLSQSVVYIHECQSNDIQTAYALPAVAAGAYPIFGSYNRFLNMQNDLLVVNVGPLGRTIDMTLRSNGQTLYEDNFNVRDHAVARLDLNDETTYSTAADTYGTIELEDNTPASFIAYTLRHRVNPAETVDFVNPTLFR